MLAGVLSGTPNTGAKPAPITDPAKMQEALKTSYADLQKAIAGLSDTDLQTAVKLWGHDMTKQGAIMLVLKTNTSIWGSRSPTRAATAWFRPGLSRSVARRGTSFRVL